MSIKRLCSIGLLNINLNLILNKSFTEKHNFNIDNYNTITDLQHLFFPKKENNSIDYLDYISLSSDDNLLNTLFFINRAYKTKTFIEYLIPNEIKIYKNRFFIKSLINEILNRNYFFVVENNIINKTSKVKLIIKILNDDKGEIISKKEFKLVDENNNIETDIFDNEYFESYKLNYDFSKSNYFFIDLDSIKSLKWKINDDLILFMTNIIKNNKIKIILSINENSFIINEKHHNKDNKEIIYDIFQTNKNIIDLSDIIFCFKNSMNKFLKDFSNKKRTKLIKNNNSIMFRALSPTNPHRLFNCKKINFDLNCKSTDHDLIACDNNKYRKNIPRLTVILDGFDYLTIYKQEFDEKDSIEINIEPYYENFCFSLLNKNHTLKEFKENKKFLENNSDKCFHIFIGGFLSRYINNTNSTGKEINYEECFLAGNLMLKNYLILSKNNIDYITDIDEYNIVVPKIKKCLKERLYEEKKETLRKIRIKEKKFVLDCINQSKSQKKEYNSLLDFNCTSFLSKKNIFNNLTKNSFINSYENKAIFDKNYLFKNKTPQSYNNKYTNINQIGIINSPLIIKKQNKFILPNNNEKKKIMLKKIYNKNFEIDNYNKSATKINNKTLPTFLYKHNINDKSDNYMNKKINIKKLNLNLRKTRYDLKKFENKYLSNRKIYERFDTSSNSCEKDKEYIKYLFKLYQPNKKFKSFLYNLSNLKPKK